MKTNKMLTLFVSLGASLLLGLSVFGQEPVHEAQGMRVPVSKETAEKKAPTPLSLRVAEAFQTGRNIHDLGDATADLAAANEVKVGRGSGRTRLGVAAVRTVEKTFDSDSFLKTEVPAGVSGAPPRQIWTMALRSPYASALRLHFVHFDSGDGSVIVYGMNGDKSVALGPFTGRGPENNGDFWTALLPGDTAFIEVSGGAAPRLEIREILPYDRESVGGHQGSVGEQKTMATAEQGCHLDAKCENINPDARDATVYLLYNVPGGRKSCTGTLLNDLDDETVVPYLLTANHCEISNANVGSLEVTFFYQSDFCGGPVPDPKNLPKLFGGVILETNLDNDMKFIRLNGVLPGGATLAGWSTGKPPDGSVGIHHPDNTFKRATFFDPSSYVFCQYTYDPNYWVMEARRGGIEGGSSGSGLFNSSGQLFGQLRGRCGPGTDEDRGNCSSDDGWRAVYGKFSTTYRSVRRWLEIGGTINVNLFHGGNELGTPSEPYRTVNAGYNLAWDNTRLKIKPGNYNERVTFSKPMTILADGGTVTIGR